MVDNIDVHKDIEGYLVYEYYKYTTIDEKSYDQWKNATRKATLMDNDPKNELLIATNMVIYERDKEEFIKG